MLIFALVAIFAYLLSLGFIIPGLLREKSGYRILALIFAAIALICHTIALQYRIFSISSGQNLSLINVASSISLIIAVVTTLLASRDKGWFLLPITYSFTIINLVLSSIIPGELITHLENSPTLLIHIVLALFAYATLIIAALYALQLAWVDYQLKHKKTNFIFGTPPMMSIERKMFLITQVGVALLTLTLITGFIFISNLFEHDNLHKAIFSSIAWCIYLLLLWGHYRKGWRGRRVIWCSFSGATILTIAYFGSRLLQGLFHYNT